MSSFFERMHAEASKIKKKIKEKSKKYRAPTAEEAISSLQDAEELLIKKQEYLELKIEQEVENAKKYSKSNKKLALSALKRKKMFEKELNQIDGVLTKLEAQRTALENAGMNSELLDVLGKTNETLKIAHNKMDIDDVNDLMDEIADGLATSDEFNQAISRPVGDVVDEDELLNELKELQDEVADLPSNKLPEVPSAPIQRPRLSRDGTLRKQSTLDELEEWATAN